MLADHEALKANKELRESGAPRGSEGARGSVGRTGDPGAGGSERDDGRTWREGRARNERQVKHLEISGCYDMVHYYMRVVTRLQEFITVVSSDLSRT